MRWRGYRLNAALMNTASNDRDVISISPDALVRPIVQVPDP
jgi:hypothetical protein